MHKISTMGFEVFSDTLDKIPLNSKLLISTISPNSYGIATKDSEFRNALKKSDILLLDGVYFGLGYFLKTGKFIVKNQGPFVADYFLREADRKKLKVFFMGSTSDVLDSITNKLNIKYPNIILDSYSPPFKKEFSSTDNKVIIDKINGFVPDILFIGMTCPKQEKWSYKNLEKINSCLILNVGAFFDWISGDQKPISSIWWKLRLAWLKRTIDRPEILYRYPNIFLYFRDLIFKIIFLKKY